MLYYFFPQNRQVGKQNMLVSYCDCEYGWIHPMCNCLDFNLTKYKISFCLNDFCLGVYTSDITVAILISFVCARSILHMFNFRQPTSFCFTASLVHLKQTSYSWTFISLSRPPPLLIWKLVYFFCIFKLCKNIIIDSHAMIRNNIEKYLCTLHLVSSCSTSCITKV